MKSKWYISTFIFVLTLLGVANQQHLNVPNQEIVLQFSNDEVTFVEAQNAIEIVKKQLLTVGADNIKVLEQEDGKLKITYYCNTDAASIKKFLSEEKELTIGFTSHNPEEKQSQTPLDNNSISYDLDVYEIEKGNDSNSNLGGKLAVQLKSDSDRLFNPNVYYSVGLIDVTENTQIAKAAYKLLRNIAIADNNTSYIIPEVRAGPFAIGINNHS